VCAAVLIDHEHAGQDGADDAATAWTPEGVQGIVITECMLQEVRRGSTRRRTRRRSPSSRRDTDGSPKPGDRDEARDRSGADADDRRLAAMRHSTNIQVSAATAVAIWVTVIAHAGLHARAHRRTCVEAEPADPQAGRCR